jgi:hypothetical protein
MASTPVHEAAAATPPPPVIITPMAPEDAALFGGLNAALADEWADAIQQSCQTGLQQLPLITNQTSQLLVDRIVPAFWRTIDVAEVYCGRYIFSVSMYPPKRRRRVVQAVLQTMAGTSSDTNPTESSPSFPLKDVTLRASNEAATKNNNIIISTHCPTTTAADTDEDDDNPTTARHTLAALRTECAALRHRLAAAHRRRASAHHGPRPPPHSRSTYDSGRRPRPMWWRVPRPRGNCTNGNERDKPCCSN